MNIYAVFLEFGVSIMAQNGILCYINPNSMLVNESYRKLRTLLVNKVDKIIKLPDNIFSSAKVETIIILAINNNTESSINGYVFNNSDKANLTKITYNTFSRSDWNSDEDHRFNIFADSDALRLLKIIEKDSHPLKDFVQTSLGITPYDKSKGHSKAMIKERIFHSETKLNDDYVPLISGHNIYKYIVSDNVTREYLKYGNWLGAPRERRFFDNEKIIIRQILGDGQQIIAGYSDTPQYFTQIGFSVISKTNDSKQLKVILGILNSQLMSYYHKNKYLDPQKILFQKILIANAKKFPIKWPTNLDSFSQLIDEIIDAKAKSLSEDIYRLEKELDVLVYHLYNISYEDISIIAPNHCITEAEYNEKG